MLEIVRFGIFPAGLYFYLQVPVINCRPHYLVVGENVHSVHTIENWLSMPRLMNGMAELLLICFILASLTCYHAGNLI